MGKLKGITELIFKGLLASYLLLFAFEIHKHPQHFLPLIANNLAHYAQCIGYEADWPPLVNRFLLYYTQFLVLITLTIVCGMRFGKKFGWVAVGVNLALTWSQTEFLYIGNAIMM